jgi:hypothetical protein
MIAQLEELEQRINLLKICEDRIALRMLEIEYKNSKSQKPEASQIDQILEKPKKKWVKKLKRQSTRTKRNPKRKVEKEDRKPLHETSTAYLRSCSS